MEICEDPAFIDIVGNMYYIKPRGPEAFTEYFENTFTTYIDMKDLLEPFVPEAHF